MGAVMAWLREGWACALYVSRMEMGATSVAQGSSFSLSMKMNLELF
jgi:hypothetical protein